MTLKLPASGNFGESRYYISGPCKKFDDGVLYYEYSLRGDVTFADSDPIPASFFFFNDKPRAKKLFNLTMRADHETIVKPLGFGYDNTLKRHVIAVKAIDDFLEPDRYKLFSDTVFENPHPVIQNHIKRLILGFRHLHKNKLSCSALHSRGSFVLVGGELKILFVDVSYEELYPNTTSAICEYMVNLSKGIRNHLLRGDQIPDAKWHQRFYFIESFTADFGYDFDAHLQMLIDNPFLEENPSNILEMFFDTDRALDSGDDSTGYNSRILKQLLLKDKDFQEEIMIGGTWEVEFSPEFASFLRRDYGGKKARSGQYPYDFRDMRSLFRCLGNFYTHHYESPLLSDPSGSRFVENVVNDVGLTPEAAYFEVIYNWPTLIPILHVKLAQSKLLRDRKVTSCDDKGVPTTDGFGRVRPPDEKVAFSATREKSAPSSLCLSSYVSEDDERQSSEKLIRNANNVHQQVSKSSTEGTNAALDSDFFEETRKNPQTTIFTEPDPVSSLVSKAGEQQRKSRRESNFHVQQKVDATASEQLITEGHGMKSSKRSDDTKDEVHRSRNRDDAKHEDRRRRYDDNVARHEDGRDDGSKGRSSSIKKRRYEDSGSRQRR